VARAIAGLIRSVDANHTLEPVIAMPVFRLNLRRHEQGQAMLETAFCVMFFFLLLGGMVDVYLYDLSAAKVKAIAREAALVTIDAANGDQAAQAVTRRARELIDGNSLLLVPASGGATCDCGDFAPGHLVRVNVRATHRFRVIFAFANMVPSVGDWRFRDLYGASLAMVGRNRNNVA
jgi:hypothetical protein